MAGPTGPERDELVFCLTNMTMECDGARAVKIGVLWPDCSGLFS
jgi:hypothetical protein